MIKRDNVTFPNYKGFPIEIMLQKIQDIDNHAQFKISIRSSELYSAYEQIVPQEFKHINALIETVIIGIVDEEINETTRPAHVLLLSEYVTSAMSELHDNSNKVVERHISINEQAATGLNLSNERLKYVKIIMEKYININQVDSIIKISEDRRIDYALHPIQLNCPIELKEIQIIDSNLQTSTLFGVDVDIQNGNVVIYGRIAYDIHKPQLNFTEVYVGKISDDNTIYISKTWVYFIDIRLYITIMNIARFI